MTRPVHSGGTVARSADTSHRRPGASHFEDSRQMCLDMARQGYGWEDIMVRAQVSRRVARWLVLGVVG